MKKTVFYSILILLTAFPVFLPAENGQKPDGGVKIALTGFSNMDSSPEHDYLGGLITAVLREDLSGTDGITLLDRGMTDRIISEQELQLSGLIDGDAAVEAGKLLGAGYLAGGSFVVIGTEVLLDLTLVDVETSKVISFSGRGATEDMIHSAAEKLARTLTGRSVLYRNADSAVPIIKQELLPPGMLKLFSPLVDARIYLDGKFYGYTRGDSRIPIEIELQPGEHRVETDLGSNFGVVIEPEIIFEHWKKDFIIESGKTLVLEDQTRHYNDRLYNIQKVLRGSHRMNAPDYGDYHNEWPFSFTDREGTPVEGVLTLHLLPGEDGTLAAEVMIKYDWDRKVYSLECAAGEYFEFDEKIGLIDFSIDLDCRYQGRAEADWSIWRNDVYQGLHREEGQR